MSTLDYDDRGQVTITGQATAGRDGARLSRRQAGGRRHGRPRRPLAVGADRADRARQAHTLRLDRLAQDGKPTARLEMPFDRAPRAARRPATIGRLHVVRGDNLWNIARAHYGEGWRYTVIFDANKEQIRDPDLIYPGPVFSLPKVN